MSKIVLESHSTDLISPTFPYTRAHRHSTLSSRKQVSPPSSWSRADPSALWGSRGLFGRMWTQRPVSYRRGWPEIYWILGAEAGALGQSGRLRVSRAGLELRHLQEQKWGVLNTEDNPHPWLVGVRLESGGNTCSVAISPDSSVVTIRG